jgi:sterol desaturase/sphingolipid hydroxylase (fatty acid hydroxylase superfamily)
MKGVDRCMSRIAWKRFVPFVFYTAVAAALVVVAAVTESRSWASTLVLVAGGALSWSAIEYAMHRFAFHYRATSERGKKFVYDSHLVHHDHPRDLDDIFANLSTSGPLAAAYLVVALATTGSPGATAYLFLGLMAGYFTYEWLHYQAHHRSPRTRLFRYLKKYHMLHHHGSNDLRFGVTSPVFDLLLGTWGPVGRASNRSR